VPVRIGEQCSIGFQPVLGRPLRMALKNGQRGRIGSRSISAGHRLEAYATMLLGLAAMLQRNSSFRPLRDSLGG
jgi:hypothetical protein